MDGAPANRSQPTSSYGPARGSNQQPVAAESSRRLGARSSDARLRRYAAALRFGANAEGDDCFGVARLAESQELLARADQCWLVAPQKPVAADGSGDDFLARALAERYDAGGELFDKGSGRGWPKWLASDQQAGQHAQDLQWCKKPYVPCGDTLDCGVDDIRGCMHP